MGKAPSTDCQVDEAKDAKGHEDGDAGQRVAKPLADGADIDVAGRHKRAEHNTISRMPRSKKSRLAVRARVSVWAGVAVVALMGQVYIA